jgi:outer membrane protein TolC
MQVQLKIILLAVVCLLTVGCATTQYQAKPLDIKKITAKILTKDPHSKAFNNYLIKQGYQKETLPFKNWGLDELTLSALFHHTKLDVAKAQLALATSAIQAAGIKQRPVLNGSIEKSNQANGDKRPWAYGLNIEIPIETNNKRALSVEEAQRLADAAHMDVADVAWQLRNQIAVDFLDYHQNVTKASSLNKQLTTQNNILSMLQKRVDSGIAPKTALSVVKLQTLKTQSALSLTQASIEKIRARLAADVGLTASKFKLVSIKPLDIEMALSQQARLLDMPLQSKALQEQALLNRIDVRRSMQQYLAAEARIKLEIAKQTPDITINPGFVFDFGDKIWSLGFSSLLNLLNKNQTLVAKAIQLRAVEGAQFEHLQAQIIAHLEQQYTNYHVEKQIAIDVQTRHSAQRQLTINLQKQFDAGIISRLDLNQASLASIETQQQVSYAKFSLLKTMQQIEDVLQAPLYNDFIMPN